MWTPSRREVLGAATAALGTALFGTSCSSSRRPWNVLFICFDDLNDWVGCLGGHPDTLTPNIDRLAHGGVLFTRAYSDGTNCPASRAAVTTGLSPTTTGIYGFQRRLGEVLPDAVTVPDHFMANGYRVYGCGKIFHVLPGLPDTRPEDRSRWHQYHFPKVFDVSKFHKSPDATFGPVRLAERRMWDARVAAWAAEKLRLEDEAPFFLGVGFYLPHEPWFVPRRFFRGLKPEKITLPPVLDRDRRDVPRYANLRTLHEKFLDIRTSGRWRGAVAAYLAAIRFADAQLGKVLDALDESPHRDRTIVALWSDHGFLLGHKQAWSKFALWEQATRVPLIVSAPGLFAAGRCEQPVTLLHLYPTLVDLCGLPPRRDLDGRSLRPLLENPRDTWDAPAISSLDCGSHAIRTARYRYIRYMNGSEELYDHDQDPHEWHNLAGQSSVAKLKEELGARLPKGCSPDA